MEPVSVVVVHADGVEIHFIVRRVLSARRNGAAAGRSWHDGVQARPSVTGTPPSGRTALSDARLTVPVLGSFQAQGEMFLSAQEFHAALSTGRSRFRATRSTCWRWQGAWKADYVNGSYLRMSARNPSVKVLGIRTGWIPKWKSTSTPADTSRRRSRRRRTSRFCPASSSSALHRSRWSGAGPDPRSRRQCAILNGPNGWRCSNSWACTPPTAVLLSNPGCEPARRHPDAGGRTGLPRVPERHGVDRPECSGAFSLSLSGYELRLLEQALATGMKADADSSGLLTASGTLPRGRSTWSRAPFT